VEINPLMSFNHLRMLHSASKCLKIALKIIKMFKTQKKLKLRGDIPLESFEGGALCLPLPEIFYWKHIGGL
jgi:hypothetical protein